MESRVSALRVSDHFRSRTRSSAHAARILSCVVRAAKLEMENFDMSFNERNQSGMESEQYVRAELEKRGYFVHPLGRSSSPHVINNALNLFRDTYSRPCRLRWQPEFLVVRPDDPQSLRAVEVKRHRGMPQISRPALNTYLRFESAMWLPVLIVFHCPDDNEDRILRVIPAGECLLSGKNQWGNEEYGSGEPFFNVDRDKLHPFDEFFGEQP
jgi:hypothetical protein